MLKMVDMEEMELLRIARRYDDARVWERSSDAAVAVAGARVRCTRAVIGE